MPLYATREELKNRPASEAWVDIDDVEFFTLGNADRVALDGCLALEIGRLLTAGHVPQPYRAIVAGAGQQAPIGRQGWLRQIVWFAPSRSTSQP